MGFLDRLKAAFVGGRLDVKRRFELLREAISGTMSKFYMARDRRTGRVVGLKILDREKTAAFEARFRGMHKPTEGEIALHFHHRCIIQTYEHGLTTEGAQYLVMEFLEGPGLNSMIVSRDPRLEGNRVKFLRQVAEALGVVHRSGFIHRDVCPRNLILTGDAETLKLTDFGLTVPATPPFMKPGNRTGTPNYMAPELVRRLPTDPRLDIFAFGVTAYEMCTGQLPWQSGHTGQVAMTHDQPPENIRRLRPRIHEDLARAIHLCLEPDAARRCPSMEHFLGLIRFIEHEDTPEAL